MAKNNEVFVMNEKKIYAAILTGINRHEKISPRLRLICDLPK